MEQNKEQNVKQPFTIKKRLRSFVYAYKGLKYCIRTQHNFWIHIVAAVVISLAGYYYNISSSELCIIVLCIGGVMMAEGFNTAIELIVDFISPQYHKKAGIIKDVAAASVLLFSVAALICGLIIFIPKIYN